MSTHYRRKPDADDRDASYLFQREKERDEDRDLLDFLLFQVRDFRDTYEEKKRRRDSQAQKVFFAAMGKTLVDENEVGLLEELELEDGEIYVTDPIFGAMFRSNVKEATKSNPAFMGVPRSDDMDEAQVARYCSTFFDHYDPRFFTHRFEQGDVQNAQGAGFTLWDLSWDRDYREDDEGGLEGWWCKKCHEYIEHVEPDGDEDAEGNEPDEPEGEDEDEKEEAEVRHCPDCGTVLQEAEEEGDLTLRAWHPFQVNFDAFVDEQRDMKWLCIDEIIDIAVLRKKYRIDEYVSRANILNDTYLHLRRLRSYQRAQAGLETSYNLARSQSELLGPRESVISRDYLSPVVYWNYRVPSDCTVLDADGEEIKVKAGTRLREIAPNGIGIVHCHLKEAYYAFVCSWQQQYLLVNHSVKDGDLSGTTPAAQALELQYNLDELLSQALTAAHEMGSPTYFYDEAAIEEGMGQGGSASLKIPMRRRVQEVGADQLVKIVPPAGVSDQIFVLADMSKRDMQAVMGSYSPFGGGLPDAAGNTATGQALATAQGDSLQGMYLSLRAEAKGTIFQRALPLFRKHVTYGRAMRMAGSDGGGAVLYLSGEQLPRKVDIVVKENSFWPRELYQRQSSLGQFYQMKMMMAQANQLSGAPTSLAELRQLATLWQQDVTVAEMASECASERIKAASAFFQRFTEKKLSSDEEKLVAGVRDQMEEAALEASESLSAMSPDGTPVPPPPTQIEDVLIQVALQHISPIDEGVDYHSEMAEYYKEYANQWRGRHSPRLLRRYLSEAAKQHGDAANQQRASLQAAMMGPQAGPAAGPPGGPTGGPAQTALLSQMQDMGPAEKPAAEAPGGSPRILNLAQALS